MDGCGAPVPTFTGLTFVEEEEEEEDAQTFVEEDSCSHRVEEEDDDEDDDDAADVDHHVGYSQAVRIFSIFLGFVWFQRL